MATATKAKEKTTATGTAKAKAKATGGGPTLDQFGAYNGAFEYFNAALFGGELPPVILNFSRKARSGGFFAAERWSREEARAHEISLNPDVLDRPPVATMATLVHEMVHLWQQVAGTPSRPGYHNAEWAAKMEAVGLVASSTGAPGGKVTGPTMSHYILEGRPFDVAFRAMPAHLLLPWKSGDPGRGRTPGPKPEGRHKYTCPACGLNAWARPDAGLVCEVCGVRLDEEGVRRAGTRPPGPGPADPDPDAGPRPGPRVGPPAHAVDPEVRAALDLLDLVGRWPCDAAALKAAYRRRSKAAHPDAGGSDEGMSRVNDAYELLASRLV